MQRYAFLIQYIGKNYAGSQIQFGKDGEEQPTPTIQGELEKAITTLLGVKKTSNNKRPIKTVFSGRTDTGVNSTGQVVHVDLDKEIVASKFIKSVNALLPKDISISDLHKVDSSFHSQKSAQKRYYRYVFLNREQRKAFDGNLLRIEEKLNLERMNKSLSYLLGEHDFSSFKNTGSSNPSDICYLYKAECWQNEDMIITDIVGSRFLYNMVRIIVGTVLDIEHNNRNPEYMKTVLDAKDRSLAGKTVTPDGLTLIKVEY
jgi:tRNA pseudouridine38-40 synthase